MGSDLIMNSDPCVTDRVIAVGIGNSNQLLKLQNKGLLGYCTVTFLAVIANLVVTFLYMHTSAVSFLLSCL